MDFNDTPEEAAFRAEARQFLEANVPRRNKDSHSLRQRYDESDEAIQKAKIWQRKKADAGFAGITWDKRVGGRGGTPMQHIIFHEEEAQFEVPSNVFAIGLGMCIPTMIAYAKPEQLERFVAPALRGEEIWCQLFSEPAGGSDVAALRTRAERDGDDWVINGSKIWTSGGHLSDYGILLTRTDPSVPKHAGLTMFFIDMKAPGIEIRRIKQISGTSNFCEIFFTDLRIPDAQRLGPVNGGWKVALTTLMNERLAVGGTTRPSVDDLRQLAEQVPINGKPAIENAAVRERIADWYAQEMGITYARFRNMTKLSRGQTPGPESSIGKIVSARLLSQMAEYGAELQGQAGAVMDFDTSPMQGWFQTAELYAPGMRIAGGTDEILRNIIAERVLSLPGDVRVDKDQPFNAPA